MNSRIFRSARRKGANLMGHGSVVMIVVACLICTSTAAHAAMCDTFYTKPDASGPHRPEPHDPHNLPEDEQENNWDWPSIYVKGLPPDGTLLPGETFTRFAHENFYVADKYKIVTLEFDYAGTGTPTLKTPPQFGYHPLRGVGGVGSLVSETAADGHYKMVYKLDPQPDWESFPIRNDSVAPLTISNVQFTTECIPEPGTLLLLGTGLALLRRRRG